MAADRGMIIRIAGDISELKRNLAEGKSQIDVTTAAMGKLAASLEGNKLIQHAHNITAAVQEIGGVTKLTTAEKERLNRTLSAAVEKYQVMGKEAPASMLALEKSTRSAHGVTGMLSDALGIAKGAVQALGITLGAGFFVRATGDAVAYGDALQAMHEKTRINAESLQVLERVARDVNVPMSTLTTGITELARRLATGDTSAAAAARLLGLNVQQLIAMKPEDAFAEWASATGRLSEQGDRASVAQAGLGRSGRELLALMIPGYKDLANAARDSAVVISAEQVKALDDIQLKYDTTIANIKAAWAKLVVTIAQGPTGAEGAIASGQAPGASLWLADIKRQQAEVRESLAETTRATQEAASAQAAAAQAGTEAVVTHGDVVAAKLQGLRDDYYKPFTEEVRINVIGLKEWGASNQEIAEIANVTEGQIRRIVKEFEDEEAATKKSTQAMKEYTDSVLKMQAAHDTAISSLANKLFGYDDIERARQYIDAIGSVENVSRMNIAAQEDLAKAMRSGIEAMFAAGLGTDDLTSTMEAFRLVASNVGTDVARAMREIQDRTVETARVIGEVTAGLTIIGQTPPSPLAGSPSGPMRFPTMSAGLGSVAYGQVPSAYGMRSPSASFGPSAPSSLAQSGVVVFGGEARASGGPVSAGQPYMVGEHGPELFLPRVGGTIMPNGGATSVVIQSGAIQINYPIMNDPRARAEIADMVGEAIMARLRARGLRVPSGA